MEVAMDVTFADWTATWGISDTTYGIKGVRYIIDTVGEAGISRIHWRAYAAGPMYPSRVKDAGYFYCDGVDGYARQLYGEEYYREQGLVNLGDSDSFAEAVQYAHSKGIKVIAWDDQTENHGGSTQCKWSKLHPEYWYRGRNGAHNYPDRQLSLAYPEVVDYYLALIREMVEDYGADGIHLVFASDKVGYSDPVLEDFHRIYGTNPRKLSEDDPRWVAHRSSYVKSYLRKVRDLISGLEEKLCREIELSVEGQSSIFGPQPVIDEPGWQGVPSWACANELVQAEEIAGEGLADTLTYWRFSELDQVGKLLKGKVNLATRYSLPWDPMMHKELRTRFEGAVERDVDLFIIKESHSVENFKQWGMFKEILA